MRTHHPHNPAPLSPPILSSSLLGSESGLKQASLFFWGGGSFQYKPPGIAIGEACRGCWGPHSSCTSLVPCAPTPLSLPPHFAQIWRYLGVGSCGMWVLGCLEGSLITTSRWGQGLGWLEPPPLTYHPLPFPLGFFELSPFVGGQLSHGLPISCCFSSCFCLNDPLALGDPSGGPGPQLWAPCTLTLCPGRKQ